MDTDQCSFGFGDFDIAYAFIFTCHVEVIET